MWWTKVQHHPPAAYAPTLVLHHHIALIRWRFLQIFVEWSRGSPHADAKRRKASAPRL